MQYRRLGRTNLSVSAVGFGTCQLRLVPEEQALATLRRGFELGVNLVHTAPDYEGADDLVARAVLDSGKDVIVCSQGYGPMSHFEHLFESACARYRTDRLDLFGVACVDDREALGENVWGPGGMVEFLLRKKRQGRLGGLFCTTHGTPDYLRQLLERDVFDALMVAYNPLGFHLLSFAPGAGRQREDLARTRDEIFPLAKARDVGLMVMKPLAGGLLCAGKAFPPRAAVAPDAPPLTATAVLRSILADPAVASVVPGTASPEEAEENARAGHLLPTSDAEVHRTERAARSLDAVLCSRCGGCDTLCSQRLPVSWLFRAAYIGLLPSETFETPEPYEYFRLHPAAEPACASCPEVTCSCPAGVAIPANLSRLNGFMNELRDQRLVPPPPAAAETAVGEQDWAARVLTVDVPPALAPGAEGVCRLWLENRGRRPWFARAGADRPAAVLDVRGDGVPRQAVRLRQDAHPGERAHFVFTLNAPRQSGPCRLHFALVTEGGPPGAAATCVLTEATMHVTLSPAPAGAVAPPAPVYGAAYLHHNWPARVAPGAMQTLWLTLENRGTKVWRRDDPERPVQVAVALDGVNVTALPLPRPEVHPGERVTLFWTWRTPTEPGRHALELDLVEQNVTFFKHQGVPPLCLAFETPRAAPTASARLMDRAFETNPWFFLPSQGVYGHGDATAYPLFARAASGCRITDREGRQFLDYVMGWGCALLGYAHPRLRKALAGALDCGAVLTLTHEVEVEVSQALCDWVPCAEMVLFGKNGSDVCTAAVRLARLCTGRRKVLVCGYHGWQDWYVERHGFDGTGVPERATPLVRPFAFNDADGLERLLHEHRGEVAAVMLEPAAPVEGPNGPIRDADPAFLRRAAELARQAGALLIFDEVFTGFRYPQGSVQKATGVVPDLACFGKALSAGMPLSALVGRREFFQRAMARAFYGPTYKGEVYSFVAAREALAFYRQHDVPGHVWKYGERLRQGVNGLARRLQAPAELIGPPFRLMAAVRADDPERVRLLRTLLQQELVKNGVLTYRGVMIPSLAHDDRALAETLKAFERALGVLAAADRDDAFARHLEIPPLD